MLFSILLAVNFLTVVLSEPEPQVAFWCGKVNQHVDLKTGKWVTDENGRSMCATTTMQRLLYCKHVYPDMKITNIVEATEAVIVDKWCDPINVNCTASKEVIPYRCLAGPFEADALLVPKGCQFAHIHKGNKCKPESYWYSEAEEKCKEQEMKVNSHGVLMACGIEKFSGVEYVCCPKEMTKDKPNKHPAMKLIGGREDVEIPTEHPKSLIEKLEKEAKKYTKHLIGKTIGCDHKKYHQRRKKMETEHKKRMSKVIREWENAEKRYNILKNEDFKQAEQMLSGVMGRFKKIVAVLEQQAKLERLSLHEEHSQCMQIDLNDKKNKVLRSFLKALKKTPVDENAILKAIRKFVNISNEDRIHNHHQFEHMIKSDPENADKLRRNFQAHLKYINDKVNQTMQLLYKVPKVARKFNIELPAWVPKLHLPTEKPTTLPKTESQRIDVKESAKRGFNKVLHKDHGRKEHHHKHFMGSALKPRKKTDPENEPENELFESHHSPASFAIVIGLSCGALFVMIIIIIAMAMRRTRMNNLTKTVLVDPDADPNSEKQHLANLQQNGYENPIYKLTSY